MFGTLNPSVEIFDLFTFNISVTMLLSSASDNPFKVSSNLKTGTESNLACESNIVDILVAAILSNPLLSKNPITASISPAGRLIGSTKYLSKKVFTGSALSVLSMVTLLETVLFYASDISLASIRGVLAISLPNKVSSVFTSISAICYLVFFNVALVTLLPCGVFLGNTVLAKPPAPLLPMDSILSFKI